MTDEITLDQISDVYTNRVFFQLSTEFNQKGATNPIKAAQNLSPNEIREMKKQVVYNLIKLGLLPPPPGK